MIEPAYIYRAACARVVDGDTFVAQIDLGFRVSILVPVRIHGVNCPEHDDVPAGPAATAWVQRRLSGTPLVIESYKDRRSFERWVADVWTPTLAEPSLAKAIIDAGHGVPLMV